MLAEPVSPLVDELHVLEMESAVKDSDPVWAAFTVDLLTLVALAELVTVPPGVPWVLTVSASEVYSTAGPNWPTPDGDVPVTGVAEPPSGSATEGSGPFAAAGPPKRLTVT
jgi:hypothetical protein